MYFSHLGVFLISVKIKKNKTTPKICKITVLALPCSLTPIKKVWCWSKAKHAALKEAIKDANWTSSTKQPASTQPGKGGILFSCLLQKTTSPSRCPQAQSHPNRGSQLRSGLKSEKSIVCIVATRRSAVQKHRQNTGK